MIHISPNFMLDFTDFGLPSTCYSKEKTINISKNIMYNLLNTKADLIVLEFGDAILGTYHVIDVLNENYIKSNLDFVIVVGYDICGIESSINRLKEINIKVDFISGPIANGSLGIELIEKHFSLKSETNQGNMPILNKLIKDKNNW